MLTLILEGKHILDIKMWIFNGGVGEELFLIQHHIYSEIDWFFVIF